MAENGLKEAPKNPSIPSITILDSDDEEEQTAEELFEGFTKAVQPFLKRQEVLLLRVKFQALCPDFKCSSQFKDMLRRKTNQVHKFDVYIHFNEVLNAIIRNAAVYGKKGSKMTQENELIDDNNSSGSQSQSEGTQEPRQETLAGKFENFEEDSLTETLLNQSNESVDNDIQFVEETQNTSHSNSSGNFQSLTSSNEKSRMEREKMRIKRKKLISKLEAKLKYTSDEIKRLSQAELSLDEMEYGDSSYIMESRLKNRFNSIWNKLCKLRGRPTNTGRVIEGSIKCKTSGFPAIDKAIGKFLKKLNGFPDIFDIRNIIMRVNKKRGLGISQGVQNDIAADILTHIGNKLQKKRKKDFEYNFGCHLTDDCLPSLDPALHNSELRQKLEENKRVNQNALDSVFEKYVHLGRVKGPRDHGTDSNYSTTESDSESDKESHPSGKRKEREHLSEGDTEDKSSRKKHKKMKASENRKVKNSVEISVIPTTSATDMPTAGTESGSVEVENSNSKVEKNSTFSVNGEVEKVDDEIPSAIITTSVMSTSVLQVVEPCSLEVEESAQHVSEQNGEPEGSQDISILDEKESNEVKDVSFTPNSSGSEKPEPKVEAPSTQITTPNPEIEAVPVKVNGFCHDNVIEIIDNDEISEKSHDDKEKTGNDKSLRKQKRTINSTKLLEKIQELKENQLSKFTENKCLTNSSLSESSEKVDSCHSKRKATSVRHITQNQEHPHNSPSNGILDKQTPDHDEEVKHANKSEGERTESVSKISLTLTTSEFSPKKGTSGWQESLKNCPSNNLKNNSTLQTNTDNITQIHSFSTTSVAMSSSSPEFLGPNDSMSRVSSKFSPNNEFNLPKQIDTVIIISDDEDD